MKYKQHTISTIIDNNGELINVTVKFRVIEGDLEMDSVNNSQTGEPYDEFLEDKELMNECIEYAAYYHCSDYYSN